MGPSQASRPAGLVVERVDERVAPTAVPAGWAACHQAIQRPCILKLCEGEHVLRSSQNEAAVATDCRLPSMRSMKAKLMIRTPEALKLMVRLTS